MDAFFHDLRHIFRGLIRQPAFTLVIVITLALGIGANTAIFSVIYSVLLKPMPFNRPDRIVLLWGDDRAAGNQRSQVSHTDIVDYRAQQTSFEAISTFTSWNPLLSGSGSPARIDGAWVGDDFFKVLGAEPQLGRSFLPEEQQNGKDQVVVLSNQLWRQQFNSDPQIVGKSILLNLRPYTVVGVMGPDFPSLPATLIGKPALVYRPVAETASEGLRSARHLRAIGRLKDQVTLSQAQADLSFIAERLESAHPEANTNWGIHLVGLHHDNVRDLQRSLWLMLGAVGFVLLIACANVANLLLARSTQRASDIRIRAALGASQWRLLRQSLTESIVLALAGAALGLLLTLWAIDLVKKIGGEMLPQLQNVELSLPALVFTLGISVLTALIFGLAPALHTSRVDLNSGLKAEGRVLHRTRLRSALVVSEVAFALVLLMCAGLLVRSVIHLYRVDVGFDYAHSLKMDLALPSIKYSTDEKKIAFYRDLTARVRSLPGVSNAGVVTPLPTTSFDTTGIEVETQPVPPGKEPSVDRYIITPDYLNAVSIPLHRGRGLSDQDVHSTALVMLVNQKLADHFWPNQDPIGKRIRLPWNPGREDEPWRTVVGVVGDVKHYGPDKPSEMAVYLPHAQYPVPFMTLVVRTVGDPSQMIGTVRNALQGLDLDQVPTGVATMQQVMADSIQIRRFSMILLAAFAILALLLAVVGVYGVMSYAVAQRTHELGIRMALGARGHDILLLILRNAFGLSLAGLAFGAVGVFALTRLMKSLLFGVEPTDLTTFAVVCATLVGAALVACYLPARRATKVDPLEALRYE